MVDVLHVGMGGIKMKTEDLYLEYARVIKMCEGTEVKPWECVKGKNGYYFCDFNTHPGFTSNPDGYEFAVAILEDKPVFIGDTVYAKDGDKYTAKQDSRGAFAQKLNDVLWVHIDKDSGYLTWQPPEPKRTFILNGIELPCPVDWTESSNGDIAVIDGDVFWFRNSIDRDLVRDTISRIFNDARNKQ